MIYIGIDPSINSTGLTVIDGDNEYFYIIKPNKLTKAEESCQHDFINLNYILYQKNPIDKNEKYWRKEQIKLTNFLNIVKKIKEIINSFDGIKKVVMEGVAYGSKSNNLVDLAGLNYLLREALTDTDLYICAPSEVKKFASGNGNCNKQTMIDLFTGIYPEFAALPKVDDISDSFFMAKLSQKSLN